MNHRHTEAGLYVYEQPLSERMRLFMRLDSMFEQMRLFHKADEYYSIQLFLDALFDVLDFLHRYEIRAEILKELQRLKLLLERDVQHILIHDRHGADIDTALAEMHDLNLNPISALRENELFNSLRQRNFNQSGNCLFEVPAYQFWLAQHYEQENSFLRYCYSLFCPIAAAIGLILTLVRSGAAISEEYTEDGMFLKTLEKDKKNQLLRIHLSPQYPVFPRISGDNHRFAVRFMEQPDPQLRSAQTEKPVSFGLQICVL